MTYRVLQRLADGGFSEIFVVEDAASALPERLVLKRLNAEMSARPEVRDAFAAEAEILRELRHPNVVTFRRCYFDEQGRVCLLMEEVSGEPLDAWARRNAGDPDMVLDVFTDVLHAVDYLHRRPQPYLHLDLKPDNILVTSADGRPRPVLIDFGIARRSGSPGLRAYTPPYAAPEQRSGGRLGPQSDVHALGQILTELVAPLDLGEEVAAPLAQVAQRARAPSPASRHADAGELGLHFRQARRAQSEPQPPWTSIALPRPVWIAGGAAAAAAVLAVVAIVGLLASRGGDEPAPSPPATTAGEVEPAGAQEPSVTEVERLLAEARRAALDEQYDHADRSYMQAKRLASSLVHDDDDAQQEMALALEGVRRQIDLARERGWMTEAP